MSPRTALILQLLQQYVISYIEAAQDTRSESIRTGVQSSLADDGHRTEKILKILTLYVVSSGLITTCVNSLQPSTGKLTPVEAR